MRKIIPVLSWMLVAVGALAFFLFRILDWLYPNWHADLFSHPQRIFNPVHVLWPVAIWTALIPVAMILVGLVAISINHRLGKKTGHP